MLNEWCNGINVYTIDIVCCVFWDLSQTIVCHEFASSGYSNFQITIGEYIVIF